MTFAGIYRGKRVLVTGHTGFKGSWLCEWLLALGAEVTGLALPPPTDPALFDQLGLAGRLRHRLGDIRDLPTVRAAVDDARPDFIFHLAAQPLVRLSYEQPVETYATNVQGTVHLLEAIRCAGRACAVVAVTTDKCYENKGDGGAFGEDDPLGGHDPYSSSKAAAELVVKAYRLSYFSGPGCRIRLASARAGNVIGGGDWAADRIVPDCIRALRAGAAIPVRNKVSTRPWQHVLEPLGGYLWLGAGLAREGGAGLATAFNFGPRKAANRTVGDLVGEILRHWPGRWEDRSAPSAVHEARLLGLATGKARSLLGWQAVWDFDRTVEKTVQWYRRVGESPASAAELTRTQISSYEEDARRGNCPWSQ